MGEDPPKYQVLTTSGPNYSWIFFNSSVSVAFYVQVEDVLNKKKPPPQILDLNGNYSDVNKTCTFDSTSLNLCSGMEISSKEDFKVAFDKIPDYKIRKEKVSLVGS